MEKEITTSKIPIMESNREMSFDQDTIEKLKYLTKVKNEGSITDICNKALTEFLKVKFEELNLEHFTNPVYEQKIIANKAWLEEDARKRDEARLLNLAKARIIEKEIKKIKAKEAK